MPKFKKKPVAIEAVRFTGENWAVLHAFTGHGVVGGVKRDLFVDSGFADELPDEITTGEPAAALVYDVLHETWVNVWRGQWVMRGTEGEYYPCKDDGTGQAPLNYEPV